MSLSNGEGVLDYMNSIFEAKSIVETDKAYTKWAPIYDESLNHFGTSSPGKLVESLIQFINTTEEAELLDLAAGTGGCGEELIKLNYKGKMDAMEMNASMLELANKKKIYRKLYQVCIEPGQPLPETVGSYDTIIGSSCFVPYHVEPDCLQILTKALKPGGVLIFNHRHVGDVEYKTRLDTVLEKLVQEDKLQELKNESFVQNERADKPSTASQLYIYQKL